MNEVPDYYAILQVHHTATREVIDAAYRKLASRYHPDVNDSEEAVEIMKQLNEAYEVLTDPNKRAAYDKSAEVLRTKLPLKGIKWRNYTLPIGLILIIMLASRLGIRLALIMLVFLGVLWLLSRIGK
ncbi:MAG: DnaJ domain-containing protein [Chloroflexi bacterium]|nr:DnaJ domain-containing protein [Chloroflexota bacterium]